MATILLSAAGAALGGAIGGTVAGLSTAVIGRAVGATVGRMIDQRLMSQTVMGAGSEVIETGRLDRFRLTETGEGAPVATIFGRMRVGGQVIWASDFLETRKKSTQSTGGKGSSSQTEVTTVSYSYSISLAVAVGAGEIADVSRVWADGKEIPQNTRRFMFRSIRSQAETTLRGSGAHASTEMAGAGWTCPWAKRSKPTCCGFASMAGWCARKSSLSRAGNIRTGRRPQMASVGLTRWR